MRRTLSAAQVLQIKNDTILPGGGWGGCFGEIERTGIVFISGPSTSGKSSAALSFLSALSKFGRALYVTNEEGFRRTFQDRLGRFGVQNIDRSVQFIDHEPICDLVERLGKRRSASFVVIDSIQDTKMTRVDYERLRSMSYKKMIIFVSRIEGRLPIGRLARQIKYDADLKVWVDGGRAISEGRYIGEVGKCDVIRKKVIEYWGELLTTNQNEE